MKSIFGILSLTTIALFVASCGGRAASPVAAPPSTVNAALSAMKQLPESISPGSVPAPPMAQTPPQPASAMTSLRQAASTIVPLGYTQLSGAGVFVATSPDGSIWVLSPQGLPSGDKFIYHYVNGAWTNVPGAATRIAVGPDNTPWVINAAGGIYHLVNGVFAGIAGGASDLTVGADGSLFVISSAPAGPYGSGIYHYLNGTWTQLPGAAIRIAASWDAGSYNYNVTPGGFYAINAQQSLFYWNPNLGFTQIPGAAIQLAPTINGGLFALGLAAGSNGNSIYYDDLSTGTWTQQPGAGVAIATNSSSVYVIGAAGGIYQAPVTAPTPTASQTPAACPSAPPQLVLAFPSNGATAVSDALSSVLFIYGPLVLTHLGNWGNMSLNGVTEGQVGSPPSPLPSPIRTLGPGQTYLSATINTPLSPNTVYQVSVSFTDGCGEPESESLGTFTTQ